MSKPAMNILGGNRLQGLFERLDQVGNVLAFKGRRMVMTFDQTSSIGVKSGE